MVWCYCYHLHSQLKFCENFITKIISITPFVNYVLSVSQLNGLLKLDAKITKGI
ncbi:glycerophosphoryl diester phosphodiesterase family protein [Phocaeicola salanitronis DSM 18170]|uniref:Glycerophosphoryl diester phosphodiesterase family protein n=1 Tax=Phocaeicola salanitronis (strain DSM 18170 / JCM 13657 / CCUG 60908 / BL78) TaxID=667015 RepID=F0R1Q0_PHOSB|nr:glycerophosphoryl diester phosphodiesterase family protein [Phocaeicola salanitronis DSM 18170]